MSADLIVAVSLGTFFIVFLLIVAIAIPNPTAFQVFVFRVVMALAAAGEGAVIPGFIKVEFVRQNLFTLRAGGALALFVLIYLVNPPSLAVTFKKKREKDVYLEAAKEAIPLLAEIADIFEGATGSVPAGFYAEQLHKAKELAGIIGDNCPAESNLRLSTELRKVSNGGIDASGKQPFFNVTTADLRTLREQLIAGDKNVYKPKAMKLNEKQLGQFREVLLGRTDVKEILPWLANIEVKVGNAPDKLKSVSQQTDAIWSTMEDFRAGNVKYLLVHIDSSWQCFIKCEDGKTLDEKCSETQQDTEICCKLLRKECGTK